MKTFQNEKKSLENENFHNSYFYGLTSENSDV